MNLKEIVYCYVSDTVSLPSDLAKLRKSFTDNNFSEKEIHPNKWLYKRGAGLALEFNYNSEAPEMQVIIENIGNDLQISVGNWGFPFEPLLMKKRFQRNLERIVNQISDNGVLENNPKESNQITELAKKKKKSALLLIGFVTICWVFLEVYFWA